MSLDYELPGFIHLTINQSIDQINDFHLVCQKEMFENPGDSPLSAVIGKIGSMITFQVEDVQGENEKENFRFNGIITSVNDSGSQSSQEIFLSGHSPDILLHGYPTCRSFDNMNLEQIVGRS